MQAYQTSSDSVFSVHSLSNQSSDNQNADTHTRVQESDEMKNLAVNKYVACIYDDKCFVGLVTDYGEEAGDYRVSFLHPDVTSSYKSLFWPEKRDICWMLKKDIITVIDTPSTKTGRQYHISKSVLCKIQALAKKRIK